MLTLLYIMYALLHCTVTCCSAGFAGEGVGLQEGMDYTIIAKGFRNPYRAYVTPDDIVYVTDVGSGAEDTTERLYTWSLKEYGDAGIMFNGGWPCVLTVPLEDQPQELGRQQWLADNGRLDVCQVSSIAIAFSCSYCPVCMRYCNELTLALHASSL
jgi:hypothetical protein